MKPIDWIVLAVIAAIVFIALRRQTRVRGCNGKCESCGSCKEITCCDTFDAVDKNK